MPMRYLAEVCAHVDLLHAAVRVARDREDFETAKSLLNVASAYIDAAARFQKARQANIDTHPSGASYCHCDDCEWWRSVAGMSIEGTGTVTVWQGSVGVVMPEATKHLVDEQLGALA